MEQAVFISPDSFTGRPWHFPESACIPYCRCPFELECHGFPCVTSFQPAISHCLWESRCSPSNKVRCPLVFAASCFHPGGRLQACGPSVRLVFTNSTAGVGHRQACRRTDAFPAHCHTPSKEAGVPYAKHVYGTAIPPRLPAQSLTARRITKEARPLSVCRVWRRRGTGLVVSCHPLSIWRQQDRGQTQRL